ncbi:MAG: hypothetical protein WD315_00580 [Balneolaceae bacterium]
MSQLHETSNNIRFLSHRPVWLLLLALVLAGCSAQNDQREFEQEALQAPDGYTQTDGHGKIDKIQNDPDDWRTAPFFQGLITVDPAFPNPALSTDDIVIQTHITTGDTNIRDLVAYVYYHSTSSPLKPVGNPISISSGFGQYDINFTASELARFNNASGLYRLILYDSNSSNYGNIVSYGDILIE